MEVQLRNCYEVVLFLCYYFVNGIILVDQVRSMDCQARKAHFLEILPDDVMNEVLARLETLLT
ncbi:MAG: type II toxin-antitoxin system PemK/MazF family toxin [Microcystaceae cyanobacterium]